MKILNLCFILLFASMAHGSELKGINWKEISNKDGISIFKPVDYKHSSGIVPIRFKAKINENISKVLSVLSDNSRKVEWLPNAKEVKVLEQESVASATVYYRYDAPWPFNDRDFIVQNKGVLDEKNLRVYVELKSIEHSMDPKDSSRVRGIAYDGYSIIEPDGKGSTIVEIAFLNDFGGMIPKWIINLVQRKWPYKFMKQLRSQLKKDDIKIIPVFIIN